MRLVKNRHYVGLWQTTFLVAIIGAMLFDCYQYYHMSIGGDIAQVVLPNPTQGYYEVLHDPLGLEVVIDKKYYSNPNRFFAHKMASEYLLKVPIFLQRWVSPIESIYLAIALFKTAVQLLIVYAICFLITLTRNPFRLDFLLVAILIFPLFQTAGFNRFMGVIDQSVIYTFFYALPLGLVLLCICLLYNRSRSDLNWLSFIFLLVMGPVIALGGPLGPGLILVGSVILLVFILHGHLLKGLEFNVMSNKVGSVEEKDLGARMVVGFGCVFSRYWHTQ